MGIEVFSAEEFFSDLFSYVGSVGQLHKKSKLSMRFWRFEVFLFR